MDVHYYRGTGGVIWPMQPPLPKPIQRQVTKGELRRVNQDGSPYREPAPEPADTGSGEGDGDPPAEEPPAESALKADWVGYAVRTGGLSVDVAEAMTKADLIDRFGSKQ